MNKLLIALVATSLLSGPAPAANWQGQERNRPGAFVGARLQLPLGRSNTARPRAVLAIAPTQSRISSDGMARTEIGEGVALNFSAQTRPNLTLGGTRVDRALGTDRKLGVSTGGWIAIGVGTVALALGGLALWADHVMDCEERENGC